MSAVPSPSPSSSSPSSLAPSVEQLRSRLQALQQLALTCASPLIDSLATDMFATVDNKTKLVAQSLHHKMHAERAQEPEHSSNVDLFGKPISQIIASEKERQVKCPLCLYDVGVSKFAPHLEKCMGKGRGAARAARRKMNAYFASTNSNSSYNSSSSSSLSSPNMSPSSLGTSPIFSPFDDSNSLNRMDALPFSSSLQMDSLFNTALGSGLTNSSLTDNRANSNSSTALQLSSINSGSDDKMLNTDMGSDATLSFGGDNSLSLFSQSSSFLPSIGSNDLSLMDLSSNESNDAFSAAFPDSLS